MQSVFGHVRTLHVPGAVVAAALSPDRRRIAVATSFRNRVTTRILDTRTGRTRKVLPERGIGSLVFSADGRLLVTGSTDGTARIWRTATGRLVHVLAQKGTVVSERFSPDGRSLVTASADGTAAVWDVRTGARVLLLTGASGAAADASFSPDGSEIAVAFADRLARIYSSADGRILAPLAGHTDTVTSVRFDPSGQTIVTGGDDGTFRLWSANAGDQLTPVDRRPGPVDVLFAGQDVLSVSGRQARVVTTGGRVVQRVGMPKRIVAQAAHGTAFALADSAGDLDVVGPGSGTGRGGLGVTALAYTPDGTLVTGSRDGTVRVAGKRVARAQGPVAEVSAGRGRLLVRTKAGTVTVYDLEGRRVATLPARAQHAVLSPDGTVVATTKAREADLWDAATGKLSHRLTGHRSLVDDAEFSPDGSRLVTASVDHDSRIWDVATGRLLHVLRGHFFTVRTAEFSPDGRWIVTSSQFTAGLWNADSGQLVFYLRGHTAPLTGATFSPDGGWIATGSADGTARVDRCAICTDLAGLERLARARLRSIRG